MKIRNHSSISTEFLREAIRFARPPGIRKFTVTAKDHKWFWKGWGNSSGALVCLNIKAKFPKRHWTYQYGQLRGRRYYFANWQEALIYLLAHELMHTKQGQFGRIRGRVWGARGRYSEIETDSYAIRKLREWRKLRDQSFSRQDGCGAKIRHSIEPSLEITCAKSER